MGAVARGLHTKPVVLPWGMRDIAFPPKVIPKMTARFPDATVVELPKAKHFIQEDAPRANFRRDRAEIRRLGAPRPRIPAEAGRRGVTPGGG